MSHYPVIMCISMENEVRIPRRQKSLLEYGWGRENTWIYSTWCGGWKLLGMRGQDKMSMTDIFSPANNPHLLLRGEHLTPVLSHVVCMGLISAPILGWDEIGLSHLRFLGHHGLAKIGMQCRQRQLDARRYCGIGGAIFPSLRWDYYKRLSSAEGEL